MASPHHYIVKIDRLPTKWSRHRTTPLVIERPDGTVEVRDGTIANFRKGGALCIGR